MSATTVIARFHDEKSAATWFQAGRYAGLFAPDAGLRRNAIRLQGEEPPLVVTNEDGPGDWVVEPVKSEEQQRAAIIDQASVIDPHGMKADVDGPGAFDHLLPADRLFALALLTIGSHGLADDEVANAWRIGTFLVGRDEAGFLWISEADPSNDDESNYDGEDIEP